MPNAEILSHEIDNNSIETLDEKDGLFNPVKVEDVRQFDTVSKDAMEDRAIENGILDKALKNAEDITWLAGPLAELKARLLQIRKIWGVEIAVLNEELAGEYKLIC